MPLFEAWMNSSFMTGREMICYYLLDRRFFLRPYLLTVLKEKKFAVSDKKAKNVTNPRRVRR